jgi:hypothetical protein
MTNTDGKNGGWSGATVVSEWLNGCYSKEFFTTNK